MYKKEINDIGKEIRTAVQDAINSNDFADLNHQIRDSVNEALDEIRGAFQSGVESFGGDGHRNPDGADRRRQERGAAQSAGCRQMDGPARAREAARRQTEAARRRAEEVRRRMESAGRAHMAGTVEHTRSEGVSAREAVHLRARAEREHIRQTLRRRADIIARRPKGTVSGVLCTVFGSVFLSTGILLALLFGTISLTGDLPFIGLLIILLSAVMPVGGGGIALLSAGARARGRVERFRTYVSVIGEQNYVKISELAAAVRKSEKFVRKDLKKMIELRMFPQGHISEQQNLFILDHDTYAEYETMQREVEQRSQTRKEETREERQLRETMELGREYLAKIRRANEAIPGVEISKKLTRLEKSVSRIYAQIQKSPDKLSELRRFQEYYLPTTLKLVETYREFDAQPIAGENINTAKTEIEASLDTINQAFEKLFDSLFAETAMDVSADISVLQTLLAQEGLTEEAWKAATETGAEYMQDGAISGGEPAEKSEEAALKMGV